jgi:phosphopantetheinyl transferase
VAIEKPFEGSVRGVWSGRDTLELELVGHVRGEFVFGDEWPQPPLEYNGSLDVGKRIMRSMSAEEAYDRYAFHGPRYQSNTVMLKVGERGIQGLARRREGKGSLLDIMGQQLGLYLHLTQTENVISFPVRIREMTFYTDFLDQEGEFESTGLITKMTRNSLVGDSVLKRDGKIWALARGFVCQRFESDSRVWNVVLKPQFTTLADEIAPGVYHHANRSQANVLQPLTKRYLNHVDKAALEDTSPRRQREYLISRIALKDAVRAFTRRDSGEMLYPVEVHCSQDKDGRPSVYGRSGVADELRDLYVSLASKDDDAVAIVARHPVGIDLEKIEEKPDGFLDLTFTKQEQELLEPLGRPEGIARFLAAKEACAKGVGIDLGGDPRRFEVSAVDGDVLHVGGQSVRTRLLGEEYVAGWTVSETIESSPLISGTILGDTGISPSGSV